MYEKAMQICEKSSQICDGSQGQLFMSALVEASDLVRSFAGPSPARDSVKAAILRAHTFVVDRSKTLGLEDDALSFNRVRDLWYGREGARVSGDELNYLRKIAPPNAVAIEEAWETSNDPQIAELRQALDHAQAQLAALAARTRIRAQQARGRRAHR